MKRLRLAVLALLACTLSAAAWMGVAHAQTFSTNVDEHRVVNSSLYSGGHTVDIHGTINGDVYCAGQSITIDATVHGDVLCAGQDVTITGHVDGDVRVAGQTVLLGAQVGHSVTAVAQTFTLQSGGSIGQDATITASIANMKGLLTRDALVNSSEATFTNKVGRNVQFNGSRLAIRSQARIAGKVQYTSNTNADVSSLAKVDGGITHKKPAAKHDSKRHTFAFSWVWYPVALVAMGFFALMLVLLFPRPMHSVSGEAARSPGKTLLVGFLASLAMPFVLLLLFVSLIGIPLAITVLLAWMVLGMVSGPVAAYYLGSLLLARSKKPIVIMLLGTLVLVTLYFIPILGFLVMMLAYWLGIGALVLSAWKRTPKPVYKI